MYDSQINDRTDHCYVTNKDGQRWVRKYFFFNKGGSSKKKYYADGSCGVIKYMSY